MILTFSKHLQKHLTLSLKFSRQNFHTPPPKASESSAINPSIYSLPYKHLTLCQVLSRHGLLSWMHAKVQAFREFSQRLRLLPQSLEVLCLAGKLPSPEPKALLWSPGFALPPKVPISRAFRDRCTTVIRALDPELKTWLCNLERPCGWANYSAVHFTKTMYGLRERTVFTVVYKM